MNNKKNVLAITGSASANSANLNLIKYIEKTSRNVFHFEIYDRLKMLPHFDPELSVNNPPDLIMELRNKIEASHGVIICTPEYVFSIPSGLKNAIEWCIATTVFSNKPTGLITASASGQKGHEELQLIMKTAMALFSDKSTLLISGIKSKFDSDGNLTDQTTIAQLDAFNEAFARLMDQ